MNIIRKNYLWKISSEILLNGPFLRTDLIKFDHFSFIFDTVDIDTKPYKPEQAKQNLKKSKYTWAVKFDNKVKWLEIKY